MSDDCAGCSLSILHCVVWDTCDSPDFPLLIALPYLYFDFILKKFANYIKGKLDSQRMDLDLINNAKVKM